MILVIPGVDSPVDVDTDGVGGLMDQIDWIKWGALALVTLAIGIPLFGLLRWLKAGAAPMFWLGVVLFVLYLLGGGTIDFN